MRLIRVLEVGFCGGFGGLFAGRARSHKGVVGAESVGAGCAREEARTVTPKGHCP